jgi:hypothetical protein
MSASSKKSAVSGFPGAAFFCGDGDDVPEQAKAPATKRKRRTEKKR